MKHSKTTKAMALMLSLVMITSVFVGNTLSRYVTSVSSTDSARVAVWGINGAETTMNLFSEDYIVAGKTIAAANDNGDGTFDKIMAPGTAGEAPFNIINFEQDVAPEVAYQVAIELDDSQIAEEIKNNTSIQWKLDSGAWGTLDALKTSILSLSGDASGVKVYGPGEFADAFEGTQEHKIAWQWVMDNSNNTTDTDMGNAAVDGPISAVIKVGITATQVDDLVTNANLIEGANQTVYSFDDEPLVLRSASAIENFQSVNVNGVAIDPSNYTKTSGSTVITLKPEYLATLNAGSYTIDIVSSDMTASTSFKVVGMLEQDENDNYLISTADDLFTLAKIVNSGTWINKEVTVLMTNDIDLQNKPFTPIGYTKNEGENTIWGSSTGYGAVLYGTFDGQGHTIYNLNVVATDESTNGNSSAALFACAGVNRYKTIIKNVKIDGANIVSTHFAAALVGTAFDLAEIIDCDVKNATVTSTYYNADNSGDKAGVIVGHMFDGLISDCDVENSSVTASRDAGQIAGAAKEEDLVDCTATNVTVSHNGLGTGANIRNELVGRILTN